MMMMTKFIMLTMTIAFISSIFTTRCDISKRTIFEGYAHRLGVDKVGNVYVMQEDGKVSKISQDDKSTIKDICDVANIYYDAKDNNSWVSMWWYDNER